MGPGPAGSLVMVDEARALPLVWVTLAARNGSASDPKGKEGLTYLTAELARRGAAGRPRAALDDALDGLGASLSVDVEPDSVRFVGHVLARNLDPFLDLLADVVLRPDFAPDELGRTRKEIIAQIDEARNDDQALCGRFFEQRLYGQHPYGRAPDGTAKSLARIRRDDILRQHHRTFVGPNLIFAAAGGITLDDITSRLESRFQTLAAGPVPGPSEAGRPGSARGLASADRGQAGSPADPDHVRASELAGQPSRSPPAGPGHGQLRRAGDDRHADGRSAHQTRARLWRLHESREQTRSGRRARLGVHLAETDRDHPQAGASALQTSPEGRHQRRSAALLPEFRGGSPRLRHGRSGQAPRCAGNSGNPRAPLDEVDSFSDRIRAVTPAAVSAALERHLDPDHLAITLVATAELVRPLLLRSGIAEGAIDVVAFDSY